MKKLLPLTLLSGFFLPMMGCVDEIADHPHRRPGYYDDRRTTTYVETRPVYRDRGYHDDGYYGRRNTRVYDAPRPRHSDVRVVF